MCTCIKAIQKEIEPVFITLQPLIWGKDFKLFVRYKSKVLVASLHLTTEITEPTHTGLCPRILHVQTN